MHYPRAILLLSALASAGCDSGSTQRPVERLEPLDGTGATAIEMAGAWRIAEVVVLDELRQPGQSNPTPANPTPANLTAQPLSILAIDPPVAAGTSDTQTGLQPPRVAATITLGDGMLLAGDGRDLRALTCGNPYTSLNAYDGRYAVFDLGCDPIPGTVDGSSYRLQIVLGSVTASRMEGLIKFDSYSVFAEPGQVQAGTYQVVLERAP